MLTDLPTVKSYLNLGISTNSDRVLAMLLASASDDFANETGVDVFDAANYTETRDGQGTDFMQLMAGKPWRPVNSIASLTIDGDAISPATAWNTPGYLFDATGKITLICFRFCRGRGNVVIQYAAGYVAQNVAAELQTIPSVAPFTIQVANPLFLADAGVNYFVGGVALTPTTLAPNPGQYFVTLPGQAYAGLYVFNAADAGKQVQISYSCSGIPTDIVQAVDEMTALRYRSRDHVDADAITIGETTTHFCKDPYPKYVSAVIQKYKRYVYAPGF